MYDVFSYFQKSNRYTRKILKIYDMCLLCGCMDRDKERHRFYYLFLLYGIKTLGICYLIRYILHTRKYRAIKNIWVKVIMDFKMDV